VGAVLIGSLLYRALILPGLALLSSERLYLRSSWCYNIYMYIYICILKNFHLLPLLYLLVS